MLKSHTKVRQSCIVFEKPGMLSENLSEYLSNKSKVWSCW